MKDRDPTKEPIVRKARNGSAWAWTTDIHALFVQYGPRRHWHFMEACRKAMKDVGKEHFIEGQYTRKSGQTDDCFYIDDVGYEGMCRHMRLNDLAEPRDLYQKAYRKAYDAWLKRELGKPTREEPPDLDPAIIPDDPVALEPVVEPDPVDGPVVRVRGVETYTTSLDVAAYCRKAHKNVLRDIENLNCSETFKRLNFEPCFYQGDNGKELPAFNITRSGAAFLITGFTGEEAGRFKEAYITEFDRMEALLKALPAPAHPDLPTDYLSALKQLVGATEQVQLLEQQKTVLSNQNAALVEQTTVLSAKVEEQDQFIDAYRRLANADGLSLVSDIAKVLHIPRGEMFSRLHNAGYIFRRKAHDPNSPWLAYDKWVRKGLFDHKVWMQPMDDGTKKDRPQLFATRRGVEIISLLFGKDDSGQGRLSLGMH